MTAQRALTARWGSFVVRVVLNRTRSMTAALPTCAHVPRLAGVSSTTRGANAGRHQAVVIVGFSRGRSALAAWGAYTKFPSNTVRYLWGEQQPQYIET